MHSAVFCFSENSGDRPGNIVNDIVESIVMADYARECDEKEFEEYREWFEKTYRIKLDGEGGVYIWELIKTLQEDTKKNILRAEKTFQKLINQFDNLKDENWMKLTAYMYSVSDDVYPRTGFMFHFDDTIHNQPNFIEILFLKYSEDKNKKLYLTAAYDYHF